MNVNIGELNKRIKFSTDLTGTYDEDGFPISGETIHLNCWAKVSNMSGTEVVKSGKEFAEVGTRFLIRYPSIVLNEKMTLVFANNNYDISYMNDYNFSHEYMEIFAKVRK